MPDRDPFTARRRQLLSRSAANENSDGGRALRPIRRQSEGGVKTPQLGGDARLGAKHSDPHRQIIALAGSGKTTSSN